MNAQQAIIWAILCYGALCVVLAAWAGYELVIRIMDRKRGKGRHRG